MEIWHGVLLLVIGVFSGFLNVVAGGGSLLTVPTMVFLGIPGPVANGTNRVAILVQNVTAIITFFRQGFSDFKLSLTLALCTLPGAIVGAMLGTRLQGVWFNRTLAIIMIGIMLLTLFEKKRDKQEAGKQQKPKRLALGHALMVLVGFYGGFIQVGVGFILLPVLHRVMGFDLVRVNMHKVFIIASYTIVALLIFAWKVEILWWLGACLALGYAIGGWLGTHASIKKGDGFIKIVLNVVLSAFIIKLLFFP